MHMRQEPFCIYYLDHITSLQGPTSLRDCEYFQTKVLILLIRYTRHSERRLKTHDFRTQISRRLYIIAAKPRMESTRSVAWNQVEGDTYSARCHTAPRIPYTLTRDSIPSLRLGFGTLCVPRWVPIEGAKFCRKRAYKIMYLALQSKNFN